MMENENKKNDFSKEDDKKITSWHCDIYCRKVRHISCEGEKGRDPDSPNRCPYLDEMLY